MLYLSLIKVKASVSCYNLIRIWKLLVNGSDLVANGLDQPRNFRTLWTILSLSNGAVNLSDFVYLYAFYFMLRRNRFCLLQIV